MTGRSTIECMLEILKMLAILLYCSVITREIGYNLVIMTTLPIIIIIIISLYTTGIIATNSYCDQQLNQLHIVADNIKQNCSLGNFLSKHSVILMLFISLLNLLMFIKHSVCVEENGVVVTINVAILSY